VTATAQDQCPDCGIFELDDALMVLRRDDGHADALPALPHP
jgi:hypothetical protein